MDILDTKSMSRDEILDILNRAGEINQGSTLTGKILALLFFEPSTRTRMSFDTAMNRLGGDTIDMGDPEQSSAKKGESLADTVRVIEGYADGIVLRHPMQGSARMASEFVDVPVINAGDGAGHHPTQTLLDLFSMRENHDKELESLSVGVMGDLKYGRTVHSLAFALSKFDVDMTFISPQELRLPERVRLELGENGTEFTEAESLGEVLSSLDVLYVTRIQKERFPDEQEYRRVAASYRVTPDAMENTRDDMVLMHPLPRVDEIHPDLDETSHATYFEQAHNGVPVRMAILEQLLGGDS